MPHKSGIVVRNKGAQVPQGYRDKLLENFKTSITSVVVEDGEIVDTNFLSTGYDLADALNTVDTDYKDLRLLIHCLDSEGTGFTDAQPYQIIKKDNKCLVAVLTDGEFRSYDKDGSTTSPDFNMVKEYLDEVLKAEYEDAAGDLVKMREAMDDAAFRKTIRPLLSPRGVITVVFASDDAPPITFQSNDQQIDYSFGWASRSLGWAEQPVTTPTAEAKPMSAREKLAASRAAKASGTAPPPAVAPAAEKKVTTVPAVSGTPPTPVDPKQEMVTIPPALKGKHKKKWITRNRQGKLPAGWQMMKEFPASELKGDSALRQWTGPGPKPAEGVTEGPSTQIMPQRARDMIAFIKTAKPVEDPEAHFDTLLDKYDPASLQLQLPGGVRDILHWNDTVLREACKDRQTAFAIIVELAALLIEADPTVLQPEKDEEEETPDVPTAAKPLAVLSAREKLAAKRAQAS